MSDWGQGAKNNNIGWGQGAINNDISWGSVHEDSWSGDTDIVGLDPIETIINAFEERVALDGGTFEAESCLNTTLTELNNEGLLEEASLVITPNAVEEGKIFSIKPTDGSGDLSVVRATTKTRVNSLGVIESVPINVAALDYTDSTCPSILVEPQRTNLATYSEDFTNSSWNKITSGESVSTPIVTANSAISPDGTMNADLIEFTPPSDSNYSICKKIISFNNSLSGSIYLKAFDESQVGKKVSVNIFAGNVQGTVLTLTNEWQRVIISGPTALYVEFMFGKGRTTWPSGGITQSESASKFYAWGAQLEVGANATSYIPTVASAVTRNADVISKTGLSGIAEITETFENGTTNVISGSPTSYTMSQGRIKQVIGV
jgi:hypothetical protein